MYSIPVYNCSKNIWYDLLFSSVKMTLTMCIFLLNFQTTHYVVGVCNKSFSLHLPIFIH